MNRNISVQAYLPQHIVAWLDNQAKQAQVSRSHWVSSVLLDLFQGQDLRDEARANAVRMQRQLTFAMCALDGLLDGHPDPTLRERVHDAYRRKVERERLGAGE